MLEMGNSLRTINHFLFALFFISGFSALVLQVVWMRELSLVFGATARAAAATLAAFFLGLAAGSGYWGRLSRCVTNPLRAYALLEIDTEVAVTIRRVTYDVAAAAAAVRASGLPGHFADLLEMGSMMTRS